MWSGNSSSYRTSKIRFLCYKTIASSRRPDFSVFQDIRSEPHAPPSDSRRSSGHALPCMPGFDSGIRGSKGSFLTGVGTGFLTCDPPGGVNPSGRKALNIIDLVRFLQHVLGESTRPLPACVGRPHCFPSTGPPTMPSSPRWSLVTGTHCSSGGLRARPRR